MEPPPVIASPRRGRWRRNLFSVLIPLLASAFAIKLILFGFHQPKKRPTDSELVQRFQNNRAAFEQLRDMFRADDRYKLDRVADWGIETYKPIFKGKPTPADFSVERYQQYLRLLHQVGSWIAFKYQGGNPTIQIWAGGTFGRWRHIDIAWMDTAPTNTVTSLDECHIPPWAGDGRLFYRHIDENWYLVTDMRPF
jgi:hypothetical protein